MTYVYIPRDVSIYIPGINTILICKYVLWQSEIGNFKTIINDHPCVDISLFHFNFTCTCIIDIVKFRLGYK